MVETIVLGDGGRAVLVHGSVFDARATWAAQDPLAGGHRLVLINRRGYGGDGAGVTGEDFEVDAADLVEVLDEGPAHLVGHSYGGVVALLAAARRPGAVRSLVVSEPPAFGLVRGRPEVEAFIDRFLAIRAETPDPEAFLPRFVAAVGGDPTRLPSPLPPPLARSARLLANQRPPWEAEVPLERLAAAGFPTLVVSGGHNALFDSVCDVLEAGLGARRAVIPGAGHSIPTTGAPYNEAVVAFWADAEAAAP